jgi:small subunit ribosomal protein S15
MHPCATVPTDRIADRRGLPPSIWVAGVWRFQGKEVVGVPLTQEQKTEIVGKHGRDDKDTGSTRVQIALLTQRITELTEHMKVHPHDHHSRRGLLKLVGRRRRLLTYMQRHDLEGYRALIKELGLRR